LSHIDHRAHGPASVACFVLTVSDTRSADTDTSGRAIRELLTAAGHGVAGHAIVRDEPTQVRDQVLAHCKDTATQVIITTGGTGITSRDGTYEAVDGLLEKRLHGFGELFRMLSFQEIGSAAMMSRATAGTVQGKVIFVLPGSENAVRLAMTRLIIPELTHVVQQVSK
jgi:molybdenum cofactor biosynthesis protein B